MNQLDSFFYLKLKHFWVTDSLRGKSFPYTFRAERSESWELKFNWVENKRVFELNFHSSQIYHWRMNDAIEFKTMYADFMYKSTLEVSWEQIKQINENLMNFCWLRFHLDYLLMCGDVSFVAFFDQQCCESFINK